MSPASEAVQSPPADVSFTVAEAILVWLKVAVFAVAWAGIGWTIHESADQRDALDYTMPNKPPTVTPNGPLRGLASADWQPPQSMQSDTIVGVEFTNDETILARCGKDAAACEWRDGKKRPLIVAPNPCDFTGESFALVMCHELGHANGWPADHRGGHFVGRVRQVPVTWIEGDGRRVSYLIACDRDHHCLLAPKQP